MSDTAVQDQELADLIAQRIAHVGEPFKWADYEVDAIRKYDRYTFDEAVSALGFTYENFEMRDSQAVSCDICGGLFLERLKVIRRHRLRCGWE
jgi:hypothetical protein